jgi:AcrR family transcriptional regulator
LTQIYAPAWESYFVPVPKIVDISKKADIGKSTFYEYFNNKADLVCQWVAEKMAGLQVPEEMLPDQSSKITILLRESCNPELASREMMAMFVEFRRLAINEKHPQAREMMKGMYEVYSDLLCGWLREGGGHRVNLWNTTKKKSRPG